MVEAMKNKRPVPGDVFEIRWPDERRQYFQFVATDGHALDSDIICVYSHRYSTEENISLEKILEDDVELYSHTSVYVGIRDGFWTLYASALQAASFLALGRSLVLESLESGWPLLLDSICPLDKEKILASPHTHFAIKHAIPRRNVTTLSSGGK